jgi:tRNA uridine 5-carboxymethylaminomethyl modification enzyme
MVSARFQGLPLLAEGGAQLVYKPNLSHYQSDQRLDRYDVIVVGGGHAGCEAALAAARIGSSTCLLTMNEGTIAAMPCNPAIGGLAKGQLVREIDALGGEMGKVIDATGIQFRMLNASKGPSVRSPRAQADKKLYSEQVYRSLVAQPGLRLVADVAESLLIDSARSDTQRVVGVVTGRGMRLLAKTVVLTTGTFLRGLIHIGQSQHSAGRGGEPASIMLSGPLAEIGLTIGRL